MNFLQKIKTNTAEKLTVRFFSSLFLSCIRFLIIVYPLSFENVMFFKRVPILPFLGVLIGFYAALSVLFTFINSLKIERLILLISYAVYAVFCVAESTDLWFSFGAALILLIICVYV